MSDKNIFGGGNPNSLYTPMSEDEQEALQRLIDNDDLVIEILEWGTIEKIGKITLGDLKLQMESFVQFSAPSVHIPVSYFDLVLRTRSGILLHKERQPIIGGPVMIGAGVGFVMVWDIAIQKIDPALVKMIKPGARGLTSREGNRHLSEEHRKILYSLREGEKRVREETQKVVEKLAKETEREYKKIQENEDRNKSITVQVPSKG